MGTFKNPDVWKQNLAYQIGDFVLYNSIVYMAIKPVPAGTEMSADYWYAFADGAIVPTGEISITENGEVNVAQYATANVNVEGGGGSSDFTTAEVTITFEEEAEGHILLPIVQDANPQYQSPAACIAQLIDYNEDIPWIVPLYKGLCGAMFNGGGTVTTSGNITYSEGAISITGDGTIVIENEDPK